jgi:DmsE family decaheme c-type cytochrome
MSFLFSLAGEADANEYVGMEDCKICHADYYETFSKTKMGKLFLNNPQDEIQKLVCESCHGPGGDHVASWEEVEELDLTKIISFNKHSLQSVAEQNAKCMECHKNDYNRMSWDGSIHETQNVACANCHKVMLRVSDKKLLMKKNVPETCFQCHAQKRAQMWRSSHMPLREGKVVCTDCHDPHGGPGSPLLKEATVNEVCYTCHAEKRGPLLWEHAPVRENCANCHDPHGSNYPNLLKIKGPYLCQSCHMAALHSSELYNATRLPGGIAPSARLAGKFCTNCHSRIHGSNHPSGARFQR